MKEKEDFFFSHYFRYVSRREQETTVGLKQILKKYNCKSLNLSGRELERLYQFMIATKSEEGFEDALEVTDV